MEGWTFLTNHSHVLLCIAQDPETRLRDVAQRVGITERAAQRIVADLIDAGYLSSARVGRRNRYDLHPDQPLRHPVERHCRVQSIISLVSGSGSAGATGSNGSGAERSSGYGSVISAKALTKTPALRAAKVSPSFPHRG